MHFEHIQVRFKKIKNWISISTNPNHFSQNYRKSSHIVLKIPTFCWLTDRLKKLRIPKKMYVRIDFFVGFMTITSCPHNYSCLIVSSVNDRLHPDYSLEGRTVVYRWRTPQSDSLPESKERGFHVSRSELSTMNVAIVQEAQNYTPTTNESSRKRDTQLSRDDISKGEMQLRTNAWSNELRTIKLHLWGSDCVRRALSGLAETARTRKKEHACCGDRPGARRGCLLSPHQY